MYEIEKTIMIYSSIRKTWGALTDKSYIQSWMEFGNNEPLVELEVGGRYRFFAGQVTGHFTEITPPFVLEYTWRRSDWSPDWPDSLVHFEMKDLGHAVELSVRHTNLPNEEEMDNEDQDWDMFFLEPMKEWTETDFKGALYGMLPLRKVRPPEPKREA